VASPEQAQEKTDARARADAARARADAARARAEEGIRAAHAAGDFARATTMALELYGRELSSFIAARLGMRAEAGDVFSTLTLDIWNGLPNFRFSSSFRTWAYTLARHAIIRHVKAPAERRRVDVSTISPLAERLVIETRAATETWRRTEVKDKVRELRERLSDEEQEILILRVDRAMAFDEIARVLEPDLPSAELKKRAAALRKRFERIRERLKTWAIEEGLLAETR
jgi:RNA polymerase sigma-70 factor (ECF subfamily)